MKKILGVVVLLTLVAVASVALVDRRRLIEIPDAFSSDSFWNTPLADDALVHPDSDEMLAFLAADNRLDGCVTLAGTGDDWGMPIYVVDEQAPTYVVESSKYGIPDEFSALKIPEGALAAATADAEMVVYDLETGWVAHLSKATFNASTETWSVTGGSVAYLDSNGLYGRVAGADDERNGGSFRGYNGAVSAVHYDDVAAGRVDNVLKIGVNNSHVDAVFPMIGSDGDLTVATAPLQGMHLRIRPDLDLAGLGLTEQALVIARGLQEFGAIIGDSTGGTIVLKLEDMERSGTGGSWDLDRQSLCALASADFQILDVSQR